MSNTQDQYTWKLEDIYASNEQWENDYQQVEKMMQGVSNYQGKMGESAVALVETLQAYEKLMMLTEKVFTYASMKQDEDNSNPVYQALKDRASDLSTKVHANTSFIVPEILNIPLETLKKFRKEEKKLSAYAFFLDELIREKPHVLSEKEEQLLAQSGEVISASGKIFRMLNNADLSFPNIKNEQGKEVELTHGNYQKFMLSGDRSVRKDAFNALYSSYRGHKNTLAATLSSSVKRDIFMAKVRNYQSALDAALYSDNVPPEVYDNLIETVRKNLPLMHRYVDLRKRLLGLEELHMYDVYTPVVKDVDWEFSYPEAMDQVKEALAPLGNEYVKTMTEGFDSGWVDVYERKSKTSGAYSWGPYGVHPYVLLNYQGSLHDVFTVAHEMGHAMHSYYSYNEQPYIDAHYSIFTAEVASTVNEALVMKHMLKNVKDKDKKLFLLNHYLEQIRGTLIRQTMFAEFEKVIHQKAEAGEPLTTEKLNQIYHQLNVDYYGPNMVIDENIDYEWARIPHFYNAFYVYKYATGISAATYLSQQIVDKGDSAVESYTQFLKSGGSDHPLELLKKAGVDMSSPQPVQETLNLFKELLEEMEKLT
ncbi:MAG: oligoendopeptidase F [Firmicutes bacterium]|nr:oligoendopeptidase F [Bacillota bacterium]